MLHFAVVIGGVLLLAYGGRVLARLLGQPPVIGEIAVGLLCGPVVIALVGPDGIDTLLPDDVRGGMRLVSEAALSLFLLGVAYSLRSAPLPTSGRAVGWVAAGSFLVPLCLGGVFATWLLTTDVRGTAPPAAFVLMVAVSLCVTAVPVLARILADRGMADSPVGRLAMASAAVTDAVAWLLLGLALSLADADTDPLRSLAIFAGAGAVYFLGKVALAKAGSLHAAVSRFPWIAAAALGVLTVAGARTAVTLGLTGVIGAFLIGMAVPNRSAAWAAAVDKVSRIGKALVPVFFVVASIEVFASPLHELPWLVTGVAIALAVLGKIGGGYLGARLAGQTNRDATVVGVLVNTRGLTEIVVLQAGYTANILSPDLFLALLIMALVTTAMTGPLWTLLAHRATAPVPDETGGAGTHPFTTVHGGNMAGCLPDLLRVQALRQPDAVAVVAPELSLTFRELADRADLLARRIRRMGIKPDTGVGVFAESSVDLIVGVWGILFAGAAYLPLSPEYPEKRLRFMIEDTRTRILFTQEGLRENALRLAPAGTHVVTLADAEDDLPESDSPILDPDILAYFIYTSGSTGTPKGVMVEHRAIVNQLEWLRSACGVDEAAVVLQKTPASFDAAQWEILAPACGSRVVVGPAGHVDPALLIELVTANGVTTLQCVPTLLRALLDTGRMRECVSLTRIFSGGETLDESLARRCGETLPQCDLVNLYGPTECTINSSAFAISGAAGGLSRPSGYAN